MQTNMIIIGAGQELYAPNERLFVTVTRVARDGSWADIKCQQPSTGASWAKRQRLFMGKLPFDVEAVVEVEVVKVELP